MRVTMNGVLLTDVSLQPVNVIKTFTTDSKKEALSKIKKHLKKHKMTYAAAGYAAGLSLIGTDVYAAGGVNGGGKAIIKLLQQGSKWVGMVVCIWGLWEMAIGAPDWKSRLLKGVAVYVGCLVIPLVFFALDDALTVEGWTDWMNEEPEPVVNQQPVQGVPSE